MLHQQHRETSTTLELTHSILVLKTIKQLTQTILKHTNGTNIKVKIPHTKI